METRVTNLESRMARLELIVVGNGAPGLDERVRSISDRVTHDHEVIIGMREDVKTVLERITREDAMHEGGQRTLKQVRAIGLALLALLGFGGGFGFQRVLAMLDTYHFP